MIRLFQMFLMLGLLFLPMHVAASSCCDQQKQATPSQTGAATVQPPAPEAQSAKPQMKPETSQQQQQSDQKTQTPQKESK